MYFAEQSYAEIEADNRSFVIAFANLLKRFELDHEPVVLGKILTQDYPRIDWWNLPEYIDKVEMKEMSDQGGMPSSNDAILKFRRMDEQAAGPVDHYCLVADLAAGSIIDSLDGMIKPWNTYGEILGYASYNQLLPEEETTNETDATDVDRTHMLLPHETVWDAARRWHVNAKDLIEQNGLADPHNVPEGFEFYMPFQPKLIDKNAIKYEVLSQPMPMHVNNVEGTQKQLFGLAKRPEDVSLTGPRYAPQTNITIVAIARVPIEGVTYSYYMDALSFGTYHETGRVAITSGFNHTHLSDGHVEYKKPVRVLVLTTDKPIKLPVEAPPIEPIEPFVDNSWKKWTSFKTGSIRFTYLNDMIVHDIDNKRPSRTRFQYDPVDIAGTFYGPDGVLYGRPIGAADTGTWYGIPMTMLEEDEQLYNTDVTLADRIALKQNHDKILDPQLSSIENVWAQYSRVAAQYNRFQVFVDKKVNKEKKR